MNDKVKLRVQLGFTAFFLALIPVSFMTGLINSVGFVSVLSLWALVASHGAWAEAAAVKLQHAKEDIPSEVVDRIKDSPNLEA